MRADAPPKTDSIPTPTQPTPRFIKSPVILSNPSGFCLSRKGYKAFFLCSRLISQSISGPVPRLLSDSTNKRLIATNIFVAHRPTASSPPVCGFLFCDSYTSVLTNSSSIGWGGVGWGGLRRTTSPTKGRIPPNCSSLLVFGAGGGIPQRSQIVTIFTCSLHGRRDEARHVRSWITDGSINRLPLFACPLHETTTWHLLVLQPLAIFTMVQSYHQALCPVRLF